MVHEHFLFMGIVENWENHRELTIFKAVLLSGNCLCAAQDISRKRQDYEKPLVECCLVNQRTLN